MQMLNREKVWTYENYQSFPDDGMRYEIIEGVLYVSPAPLPLHQYLSQELQFVLNSLRIAGLGWVFVAPFDVVLPGGTPVQPDLFFVAKEQRHILTPKRVDGVPKLIVEITSPSNARHDRVTKLNLYAKAGVAHFWLLDPEERTLEILKLDGVNYMVLAALEPGSRFEHPDFANLVLDIDQLFANIPPEIQSPIAQP